MSQVKRLVVLAGEMVLAGLLFAPTVYAAGREAKSAEPMDSSTNFDAQQRDVFTERPSQRSGLQRPIGWVGQWPPAEKGETVSTAAKEEGMGGGDVPPAMPRDVPLLAQDTAVPPPEVRQASYRSEPTIPVNSAFEAPAQKSSRKTQTPVNGSGVDLPRAQFGAGKVTLRPAEFDARGIQGQFAWATGYEREPIPVYVEYGFVTVVEFKTGERPSGGAFCGLCGKEGAFEVVAMSDRVAIKPREMSTPERGIVATNVFIVMDSGRMLTLNVAEVTGTDVTRTDRLEIRGRQEDASPVVDWSFERRVSETTRAIESRYEDKLAESQRSIVSGKASERFESYNDFRILKKSKRGRKIDFESCVTIGDTTILKFSVPGTGDLGTPIAGVLQGSHVRVLATRSVERTVKNVNGKDYVFFTLTVDAASVSGEQRIAVLLTDLDAGKEMRSSAGRA